MLPIAIGAAMFFVGAAMLVRACTLVREFNTDVTKIPEIESDVQKLKTAVKRFQRPTVLERPPAVTDRRLISD